MSKFDMNRSVRVVFSAEELGHLRAIATRNNMSIAELCKRLMIEVMKYDNEKGGEHDAKNVGDFVVVEMP
jgi:hypothetical protein